MQEAPAGKRKVYTAPLGDQVSARLVGSSGVAMLTLRRDSRMADLYRTRFEWPLPEMRTKDGIVSLRDTKRLCVLVGGKSTAQVTLSTAIPWRIVIQDHE